MPHAVLRKAQSQLLEILMVMIILTILIAAVIIGVTYFSDTATIRANQERQQEQARQSVETLRTRTELRCPDHVQQTAVCVDAHRAHRLAELIKQNNDLRDTYFSLFGQTTLTINPIHPDNPPVTIYNETQQNRSQLVLRSPITYYNATTQTKHLAVLKTTLNI